MYEKIKSLWLEGEFDRAFSLTKDVKLLDLISMIDKQGGIDNIPKSVIYTIVLENDYLCDLLWQEP